MFQNILLRTDIEYAFIAILLVCLFLASCKRRNNMKPTILGNWVSVLGGG